MNNKRVRTKAMAMAVAAAMAVELCPVTAFAVTGVCFLCWVFLIGERMA